jgi:hypothetical protein
MQAEGARVLAGLRSGDGPLSIRVRPSSLKAAPRPALPRRALALGRHRPARPRRPSLGGRADLTGSFVAHIAPPRGRLHGLPLA